MLVADLIEELQKMPQTSDVEMCLTVCGDSGVGQYSAAPELVEAGEEDGRPVVWLCADVSI